MTFQSKIKRSVPQAVFESKEALKVAREAHKQACDRLNATPRSMLDTGNPNHPINDGIFGYDREDFMARQYK